MVMLIWLIGISGAGKTTLGLRLKEYYRKKERFAYMIDGDEVRAVFDEDLGFSRADRTANIKRIILAAYVLDRCGIDAIVCNISPFQELRDLARIKIAGYTEIYLKKTLAESINKDVKGVYAANKGKTDLIGLDIQFDEPQAPDLIIEVEQESVEQSLEKIIRFIEDKERNAKNSIC